MTLKLRVAGAASVAFGLALLTTAGLAQAPAPAPATAPAPTPSPAATTAPAPVTSPAPDPALDPALCATYAASAVKDFADTTKKPRCKRRENNRWHAVYDRHYNWCLTATEAPVKDERQIRDGFLTRCGARPKAK
jgi:hypothetical protein